ARPFAAERAGAVCLVTGPTARDGCRRCPAGAGAGPRGCLHEGCRRRGAGPYRGPPHPAPAGGIGPDRRRHPSAARAGSPAPPGRRRRAPVIREEVAMASDRAWAAPSTSIEAVPARERPAAWSAPQVRAHLLEHLRRTDGCALCEILSTSEQAHVVRFGTAVLREPEWRQQFYAGRALC